MTARDTVGAWINGKSGRSRYYNHSTFADLLITGVIGLRPRTDDVVEIFPLLPPETWDWPTTRCRLSDLACIHSAP